MQPIILLHGALGAAQSMLSLCNILNNYAEVHILDFAGHGEAYWPEEGLSIELFEKNVLELMDVRDIKSAHIFGYSMGGFIGMRLALKCPERIVSLTTLATKFDWDEETCRRESDLLDVDILQEKSPKFAQLLSQIHLKNSWKLLLEATRPIIQNMTRYRFSTEELAQINTPIRLIVGDRDNMVSIHETIEVWQALPNADFAVMPNTMHPMEKANRELLALHIRNKLLGK